jgi:hypothetical protein
MSILEILNVYKGDGKAWKDQLVKIRKKFPEASEGTYAFFVEMMQLQINALVEQKSNSWIHVAQAQYSRLSSLYGGVILLSTTKFDSKGEVLMKEEFIKGEKDDSRYYTFEEKFINARKIESFKNLCRQGRRAARTQGDLGFQARGERL